MVLKKRRLSFETSLSVFLPPLLVTYTGPSLSLKLKEHIFICGSRDFKKGERRGSEIKGRGGLIVWVRFECVRGIREGLCL